MSGRLEFDRLEAALKQFNESLEELRALADAPVAMGSREVQEGGEPGPKAHTRLLTAGEGSTEQGGPLPSLVPEEA